MRNHFQTLLFNLELLSEEPPFQTEESQKGIVSATSVTIEAESLIERVNRVTEAGRQEQRVIQYINLTDLLNDAINIIKRSEHEKEIIFNIDSKYPNLSIVGDELTRQIFVNVMWYIVRTDRSSQSTMTISVNPKKR